MSTTPAFPFVGARAQVTVAEFNAGAGGILRCSSLKDGDVVVLDGPYDDNNWDCTALDGSAGHLVAARHLRPVPADQPGDDQLTKPEKPWRQVGALVWTGRDGVVMAEYPEDAARAVAAVNAEAGLRAGVQRLTEERDAARDAGKRTADDVGGALRMANRQVDAARAERDAARAELAAAHNTDGLGLPQVVVRREGDYLAAYLHNGDDAPEEGLHRNGTGLRGLRVRAAVALALLRARLADEATPEDGAHA